MKRIRRWPKFRRYQRAKTTRALRNGLLARRKRAAALKGRTLRGIKIKMRRGGRFETVVAPQVLSLIENPEATIIFVNELLSRLANRRSTFVELTGVKELGYDGVVVLIAILIRFRAKRVRFAGNSPLDVGARNALRKSGFFESLYRRTFLDQDAYEIDAGRATFVHGDRSVESPKTAEVIKNASTAVWGSSRRMPGVQKVLLELMTNTNNHADLQARGVKHWWLSVHKIPAQKRAVFVFVDFGVGVLASLERKAPDSQLGKLVTQLKERLGSPSNEVFLREILDGQLRKSRTGMPYRGRGLPSVKATLSRGGIANLRLLTNDVCADIVADKYSKLAGSFMGTLVCWEIGVNTKSLEDNL